MTDNRLGFALLMAALPALLAYWAAAISVLAPRRTKWDLWLAWVGRLLWSTTSVFLPSLLLLGQNGVVSVRLVTGCLFGLSTVTGILALRVWLREPDAKAYRGPLYHRLRPADLYVLPEGFPMFHSSARIVLTKRVAESLSREEMDFELTRQMTGLPMRYYGSYFGLIAAAIFCAGILELFDVAMAMRWMVLLGISAPGMILAPFAVRRFRFEATLKAAARLAQPECAISALGKIAGLNGRAVDQRFVETLARAIQVPAERIPQLLNSPPATETERYSLT